MQKQTPDRLTGEKGDPNAKHPGRSWNVHRNERPWVALLCYQMPTEILVILITPLLEMVKKE
jgi:hypothetical protein